MKSAEYKRAFDIVDAEVGRVENERKAHGDAHLSDKEKVVCDIWAALGVIENGSFQYFFENGLDPIRTAKALRTIGANEGASIFEKASHMLVQNVKTPNSWPEVWAYIEKNEEIFDLLAKQYLADEERIVLSLARYIEAS